jgi:tetratricopeptide (TPR) repeat protein/class 3 adenylate cyclase
MARQSWTPLQEFRPLKASGTPPRVMSPERWQVAQAILSAAIECDPDDRPRLLDDRCAGDAALRGEVESLLAAHERAGPVDRLAGAMGPATDWARAQAVSWEGRRVGHYVIGELLGAGGMGLVHRAHDEWLGRDVALKFLSPHLGAQPAARQRFLVEARAAAALDHPNICTIHEIGESDDGQLFIAMPCYDGETLHTRLRPGRLPFDLALPIALQIARAVGCAHARGIVHRDLKPSNVMLLADGTAKILDFGIARIGDLSERRDVPGEAALGTLAYMCPEHVRGGAVDHRGDIWSLAIVLHEMLSGARPFDGDDRAAVARAIQFEAPILLATSHPDVPAGVDDVLSRALDKIPERRYPSMAAFAADLLALASPVERRSAITRVGDGREREAVSATERRRAAVLVTIVSDHAALVEHLAPGDARTVLAAIRNLAVDVVRTHGGLVNQAIGDEIVSLFGVPAAHDDDELRALRAGLQLHARVRELATGAGIHTWSRVQSGLHVGSIVAERLSSGPRRYAVVGPACQIASRLAALAPPGDLVVSPDYRRLVAPFVHTTPSAPVVLELDAQPVTPFRIVGETGLETRLEAAERSGLTPYVGREKEIARLGARVARARAGQGGLAAVLGEAGVGKSRLLLELRERVAAANDLRVLQGRCRAYGDAAPYFPFIEMIRDGLGLRAPGLDESSDIIARCRALDPSLEPFLPLYLHLLSVPSESHPLPRYLRGEHLQAALLDALECFIAVLAARATLIVLLEDWHWADAGSRAVLARMTEIAPAHRLLLIVSARAEPGAHDAQLGEGERFRLDPLDFDASVAIMQAVLGVGRVSEALARRVAERTGGNPFFLEQVCRALLEQGAVTTRTGEAVVDGAPDALSLPDTVQAVIRTRLDNLEPETREVLRVAAVIGREFEPVLVADVLGPDVDLTRAVGRLGAAGLIAPAATVFEGGYRFTHVLTQEVSYDSLLEHQRKSLHDVIGRAIARRHADRLDEKAPLLAHHFSRAEAWREAVGHGRRAADRASALGQFADAVDALDRVLTQLPHLPDDETSRELWADVLLQQERACETLGLRRWQRTIIGELIARLSPSRQAGRLAQTYLREGDLLTLLKQFDAADRALSTALQIGRELGDAVLERHTLRSIGLLRWHEGRHADALAITERALAIARQQGDELSVATDLTNLASILRSMGDHTASLQRLEEALAMPALAQAPGKLVYALHNVANAHRLMGDPETALVWLRRADEVARTHLLPIQRSFHLTSIAHIDLQQGRVERALATYREAIALSRRARHAEGLAQSLRTLGDVLFGLDRGEEALPYLQEAAHWLAQLEAPAAEAEMWMRAAAVLERAGRTMESLETWRRALSLHRQLGDATGQLDALEGVARATRVLHGSAEGAREALAAALEVASTLGARRRMLALRNALGVLEWTRGRYAEALPHYEAALLLARAVHGRPGAAGEIADEGLILNSLGVTLIKLNRAEEARIALEESVAITRRGGQTLLEAHALTGLGHVSRTLERPDRALVCFERSLELRRNEGDRVGEAWMLHRIAETRVALGDETAARDAAAAAARIAAEVDDADLMAACTGSPGEVSDATLHH